MIKKAKKYLKLKYNLISKNQVIEKKYNHLIDCLNILKYYNLKNYLTYGPAVLLHDIGRFYEKKSVQKDFEHAKYGYNLLKKEYTDNPIILLPIKYHEEDLEWKKIISKDSEFLNCSRCKKQKIIKGCSLVRDIDIISNMKNLIFQETFNLKVDFINENIIEKLFSGQIGEKEDIINQYDEISYILCGLNLIENKQSLKYIKKHKIIECLKIKQLCMVSKNKHLHDTTIQMYDFIKNKFKV